MHVCLQVWDITQQQAPVLSFDVGAAVGDVAWAPYSSTVFAAVTDEGKVHVFDLAQNRQLPLCAQKVREAAGTNVGGAACRTAHRFLCDQHRTVVKAAPRAYFEVNSLTLY